MEKTKKERLDSVYQDILLGFFPMLFIVMAVIMFGNIKLETNPALYTVVVEIIVIPFGFLLQPLCLLLFKKSFGTNTCKVEIRNVDGTEPSRLKLLLNLLIKMFEVGLLLLVAYLHINYDFGVVVTVVFYMIVFIIWLVLVKPTDRTIADHILGMQGYKKTENIQ